MKILCGRLLFFFVFNPEGSLSYFLEMSSTEETDLKAEMTSLQMKYDDVNSEVERLKARVSTLTNELFRIQTSDASAEETESRSFLVPTICQAIPFQPSQVTGMLFRARPFANFPSNQSPVINDFSQIQLEELKGRYESAMFEVRMLREQISSMENQLQVVTMESIKSSEIMEDQVKGYKDLWEMERRERGEAEEKIHHLSEELTSLKECSPSTTQVSAPSTPCSEDSDSKRQLTMTSNRVEDLEQNVKDLSFEVDNSGEKTTKSGTENQD